MPATEQDTRATVKRFFRLGPLLAAFRDTTATSPVFAQLAKHPRAIIASTRDRMRIIPNPPKATREL